MNSTNDLDSSSLLLFGWLSLSTHRDLNLGPEATTFFEHEAAIAAISILFFRITVRSKQEPRIVGLSFGLLLACLAYLCKSYELIATVEIFSYAASWIMTTRQKTFEQNAILRMVSVVVCGALSLLLSHFAFLPSEHGLFHVLFPEPVLRLLNILLPINEFRGAYRIMSSFLELGVLNKQLGHLLFVTFHIQVGMGFLGIDFLKSEQSRRNELVRMDVEENSSLSNDAKAEDNSKTARANRFQKGAAPFIFFVAMPYMFQIILLGNMNKFAILCVEHEMNRSVRVNGLFDDPNVLAAVVSESVASPAIYGLAMNSVVGNAYEIFNRKLFSLPKILLLPGVMAKQPMLIVQIFPLIFISDWVKASIVSFMTARIETLRQEIMDLKSTRTRVESYDMKNAELLQRGGVSASRYTQRQWEKFTVMLQTRESLVALLERSKGFFAFMQRNFIFTVLIDCALANLLSIGKIVSADIFVFSRAVEDAVDTLLMRSRSEAELAQITTEISKLEDLASILQKQRSGKTFLDCTLPVSPRDNRLVMRNLNYKRGTATVRANHVELEAGIYALTGSNGSGKSTLFRVLMSCDTNDQKAELPASIKMLTRTTDQQCTVMPDGTMQCSSDEGTEDEPRLSITMPSSNVIEISQNFYWPLYTKPLEWIFQDDAIKLDEMPSSKIDELSRRVATLLHRLEFFQPVLDKDTTTALVEEAVDDEASIKQIQNELVEEKEDWFSDLSGGQKSKVEFVRNVFLETSCPGVLLIDETMAPLDPASKSLVMSQLKAFCRDSIVILIYHTDVGDDDSIGCVPSKGFFDRNIHLANGTINMRPTC